jgi:hypothetical protein
LIYEDDIPSFSYDGQWEHDERSGKGTYIWRDGHVYAGDFKSDVLDGYGIYTYPVSNVHLSYEGDFRNGREYGFGTLKWKDGQKYVGEVKDGIQNGRGVLYDAYNKIINSGEWVDGNFDGEK